VASLQKQLDACESEETRKKIEDLNSKGY